jgi:preprotein translocase subunit SecA
MGDDHIEHRMLSRGIENAQKRIESKNFDARKSCLNMTMSLMIKGKQYIHLEISY